jgi:ankyrin repeat protein
MKGARSDRHGRLPLHYAALNDDVDTARALLDGGADPNARDREGVTPLHIAAQQLSVRVAPLLLERGASIDAQDEYGNTPLARAVFNSRGDGAMIQLLRGHGADPVRANKSGQTPVGLARLIDNFPFAQWFADLPDTKARS